MKGTKRCCFRQKDKSHLFNPMLHKNHVAISFPLTSNNKRDNILFFCVEIERDHNCVFVSPLSFSLFNPIWSQGLISVPPQTQPFVEND